VRRALAPEAEGSPVQHDHEQRQPRPRDPTIVRPARDMHESRRRGSDRLSYISKFKTLPGPDGGRAECVTRESTQNTTRCRDQ
jgi:hypothetical protein